MPDPRRLFVALPVPAPIRAELRALREALDGARWTRPEQFHLTLRFVGGVEAERVPAFEAALAEVQAPPLDLAIDGLSTFPNRRRPRVLVARVEPDPALLDVQAQVEAAVRALGVEPDEKPFRPHVTLARLKRPDAKAVHAYVRRHEGFRAPFHADHFALYASALGPVGAVHERLAAFPLG
ncbi:MAG: RNA 2',3'-cyclic phosphodiesterase [Rhodothermales bacterium]|nr:RNA 2',3'-cyclic phosphodiesterase [Rhodothermales bacterium]